MPDPPGTAPVGIVVLAGGGSRRMAGRDKTRLLVGGVGVLDRLLADLGRHLPGAQLVVVGPAPDSPPGSSPAEAPAGVTWCREDPPGGGPVAGLAAGMSALPADVGAVVVVAGDQPFAGAVPVRLLAALEAAPGADGALAVDPQGRRQPLLGAYRGAWLRRRLAEVQAEGMSVRALLADLAWAAVAVNERECVDVDDPQALARAEVLAPGSRGT